MRRSEPSRLQWVSISEETGSNPRRIRPAQILIIQEENLRLKAWSRVAQSLSEYSTPSFLGFCRVGSVQEAEAWPRRQRSGRLSA